MVVVFFFYFFLYLAEIDREKIFQLFIFVNFNLIVSILGLVLFDLLKHEFSFLPYKFLNFYSELISLFHFFFLLSDEHAFNDCLQISKIVYFLLNVVNVVILKHFSDTLELTRKDFDNIASNVSQIRLSDCYFLFIAFFINFIQFRLKLQSLSEGVEEIIHFVTVIQDDFLVFINVIIEFFEFAYVAGFELEHFLHY